MTKQWIAFDAAGTLFEPAEPVENTYADCFSTLGFGLPESSWKAAFDRAFEITPGPFYSKAKNGQAIEKEWWRDLVRNAAEATGIRPDADTMAVAFEELFDHYASAGAWKLFPETETVLASLESEVHGLAITSNFDSRLFRILDELGIASCFGFVLTSAEVGARKPSPLILRKLMKDAEISSADCCLVGDSLKADGGAAAAAGVAFYHVDRPARSLADFADWHRTRHS